MTITSTTPTTVSDIYSQYTRAEEAKQKNDTLGKDQFLELLVAQMNNQNPLEPQENGAMVAELAQFSSLEGIQNLNSTVNGLSSNMTQSMQSNTALQASALVGKSVNTSGNQGYLNDGGVLSGSFVIDQTSTETSLSMQTGAGSLVQNVQLGGLTPGEYTFKTDGRFIQVNGKTFEINEAALPKNKEGNAMPLGAGEYKFAVNASNGTSATSVNTKMMTKVESVTIGSNSAITLTLAGGSKVNLSDVEQIGQ